MNLIIKRIVLVSIFILPFIYITNSFYSIIFFKALFIQGITLIIILLWLLSLLFRKDKEKIPKNIVFLLFFLYMFISIISCINGVVTSLSFWGSISRGTGVVFVSCIFLFSLVISSIFKTKKDWYELFAVFILSGIFFTIGMILSRTFLYNYFLNNFKIYDLTSFTIGNSTHAGIYLASVFFISIGIIISSEIKFQKILGVLGVLASFINPVITGIIFPGGKIVGEARTAFYSILIGIIVFVLIFLFKKISSILWKKIFVGFLITMFIFGASFIFFSKPNPINRIIVENAGPNRLVFWSIAVKGFKDKPILGWGYNSFNIVSAKYFDPIITTPGYSPEYVVDRAHNIFFDEIISTGILGTILLFLLYFILLLGLIRNSILGKDKKDFLFVALFSGLISFLIQGIMFFQTIIGWFIVAILISFVSNFCFKDVNLNLKNKINFFRYKIFFSILLIILFCISINYLVFKPYIISHRLAQLPRMNAEERLNAYRKIKKSYIGNTEDLFEVFYPFYLGTSKMIANNKDIPEKDKKQIISEVNEIVSVLENGLKKENYMDIRLLMTNIGFYSILVSLSDGNEKKEYYDKGLSYLNIMYRISPQNPLNGYAQKFLEPYSQR